MEGDGPLGGEGTREREASLSAFVEGEHKRHLQAVVSTRGGIASLPKELYLPSELNPTFPAVHVRWVSEGSPQVSIALSYAPMSDAYWLCPPCGGSPTLVPGERM